MDVFVNAGKEINAGQWDDFVSQSPQGNIYHCHAYLTNLLPDWEAVVLKEGDQIVAAFPFESRLPFWARWAYSLKSALANNQ